MNTLIVPCAGKSTRFPGTKPKWMLYYPDGKLMVEKAIEGLKMDEFDSVIITVVREHILRYNAENILNEIFDFKSGGKYRLCVLEDFTSCQAETVYRTLEECGVSGSFSVKDSDNYIGADTHGLSDYIAGININTFPKEIGRLNGKSFLILNNQGIITDIVEKEIKSEHICVGLYGFSDAELFKEAYRHLSNISDKKYEIYLSHIISYLIGTKKSVYCYLEADGYEDWGTIKDWNIVLNEKRTMILNMDGLLFEERERYGDRRLIPVEENLRTLKMLAEDGAQVILLTSADDELKPYIMSELKKAGIKYYGLITGCYLSHETLIKKESSAIPYPGCEAVNVGKGNMLRDYVQ